MHSVEKYKFISMLFIKNNLEQNMNEIQLGISTVLYLNVLEEFLHPDASYIYTYTPHGAKYILLTYHTKLILQIRDTIKVEVSSFL